MKSKSKRSKRNTKRLSELMRTWLRGEDLKKRRKRESRKKNSKSKMNMKYSKTERARRLHQRIKKPTLNLKSTFSQWTRLRSRRISSKILSNIIKILLRWIKCHKNRLQISFKIFQMNFKEVLWQCRVPWWTKTINSKNNINNFLTWAPSKLRME